MIVLKNTLNTSTDDNNDNTVYENQFVFKVNDSIFTINKKKHLNLYEKILFHTKNKTAEIQILNPNDFKFVSNSNIAPIKNQFDDQKTNEQESNEYSDDSDFDVSNFEKRDYLDDDYDDERKAPNVFVSNYDQQDSQEDYEYECRFDFHSINDYSDETDYYYENRIFDKYDFLFPLKHETSDKHKKDIFEKQFQLFLDDYDIIIPDFLIEDMVNIAELLDLKELKNEILPLKEQINNINDYSEFSELKILIELEEILMTIDNSNKNDKFSLIYSIYLYIGRDLFKSILKYYITLYPNKKQILLELAKMIDSKYGNFDLELNKEISYFDTTHQKNDQTLLNLIENDDVDSFQKIITNSKINLELIKLNIASKNQLNYFIGFNICNSLECAAFFGSIKCFKYILLNTKLDCKTVYAISGGNYEIIHILDQKHCDFSYSLDYAICFHQNEIAKWLIENRKVLYNMKKFIEICMKYFNFNLLSDFLSMSDFVLNDSKIIIMKYILYANQKLQILKTKSSIINYFLYYPSLLISNQNNLLYCSDQKMNFFLSTLLSSYEIEKELNNISFQLFYFHFYFFYNFLHFLFIWQLLQVI